MADRADEPGSQLAAVAFGAADPLALAGFWARALGWDVGEDSGDGGAVDLTPTDGTRFTVGFRPLAPEQTSRHRLHLDLTTSSAGDQQRSADELVALGGRHVDIGQTPEEGHLVLADPEDNLFCLVEPENRWLSGCPRLGAINGDGNRATGVFWSTALGWPLIWDQDEETAIRAPDGTGPIISWGGPPINDKPGENRLRLELALRPGVRAEDESARLVALGATRADGGGPEGGTLLVDPDGNEFVLRP
ncbi:MAG: hypothetical protein JWO77_818 [Ilumatobacteraceae bacterium]|nr:hypothetical protein [Ilumatobacteraceae bacterium]